MKVLYHHRIRSKDGQYVHLSELVHALEDCGHEVVLVGPTIVEEKPFGAPSSWLAKLKAHCPQALYEIMELSYTIFDFIVLLLSIRRIRPDFIYERYNLYLPSGIWAKRLASIPLLLEVNAPLAAERSRHDGLAFPKLAQRIEAYTWKGADAVLPVTSVLAKMIESRGVPHENIHVIPNGIDPGAVARIDGTRIRRSLKFATDELVLGFVGFLRDWHRLDRVVRLLARDGNDKLRFLVVGDGPARRALAELADSLGVSHRLVFTGLVPRGEILDYVAAFDIALQPDVVEYASPLKLLEYLALGRPIVAPDRPNIRELVSDGENGLLFAPDDEGAFESAVLELCGSSDLRERLSQRAARTIGERGLTWKANAARVVDIAQSAS